MSTVHAEAAELIVAELADAVDEAELASVRASIRRFSDINMSFGALSGPNDSQARASAPAQRVWWSGSRLGGPPLVPPEVTPETLPELTRADFPAFDSESTIRNCWLAVAAISGIAATAGSLKPRLVAALNELQRAELPCDPRAVVVSFDNPGLLEVLRRESVLPPGAGEPLSAPERARTLAAIRDAFEFIRAVDPVLHDLIVSVTATIVCIRRQGSSGSVSSLVGLVWLNPTDEWTVVDYAENIVHEFIHTSIFLEDLVHGVFAKPHNYTPPESLVTSAILKYPRGFNISFHSLYVALGLTIFLRSAHQYERAAQIADGIATTLPQLRRLAPSHLTPYARERFALLR